MRGAYGCVQACTEYHTRADTDPWDGVKASADAGNYLRGCIWLLDMYINGECNTRADAGAWVGVKAPAGAGNYLRGGMLAAGHNHELRAIWPACLAGSYRMPTHSTALLRVPSKLLLCGCMMYAGVGALLRLHRVHKLSLSYAAYAHGCLRKVHAAV